MTSWLTCKIQDMAQNESEARFVNVAECPNNSAKSCYLVFVQWQAVKGAHKIAHLHPFQHNARERGMYFFLRVEQIIMLHVHVCFLGWTAVKYHFYSHETIFRLRHFVSPQGTKMVLAGIKKPLSASTLFHTSSRVPCNSFQWIFDDVIV